MRAMIVMAAVVGAGCPSQRSVYVRYGDIHHHLVEIRANGYADVEALETEAESHTNATYAPDEATTVRITLASIRDLAAGCPDIPPFRGVTLSKPCGLVTHRDESRFIGNKTDRIRGHDVVRFIAGASTLGLFGGAIYCGIACESNSGAKAVALGGAGLLTLLVWAVASGARD
jgi:hypothetical protein